MAFNVLHQNKYNKAMYLNAVRIALKHLNVAYGKSVSNMHKKITFLFKFQRIANGIRDLPALKTN
jgi:hypothetical protein